MIRTANIGCGPDLRGGYDVFVDRYVKHRSRHGGDIEIPKGVRFVVADIEALPFRDKAFEHANCSNVLEHLFSPSKGCAELVRVAKAGRIKCPTWFDEILFGKGYHRWLVIMRDSKVWFFRKRKGENRPYLSLFKDLIQPNVVRFKPASKLIDQIRKLWWADKAKPVVHWHVMDWQGSFDYEEIA